MEIFGRWIFFRCLPCDPAKNPGQSSPGILATEDAIGEIETSKTELELKRERIRQEKCKNKRDRAQREEERERGRERWGGSDRKG
jgi:hypothetical protein